MHTSTAIEAFWTGWPDLRAKLTSAIDTREFGSLPDEVSILVHAIDPHLEWELGPGARAQHAFTLSAAGNAALRHLTETWLSRAPAADDVWEFHPARQPRRGWALELDGHKFEHEHMQVTFEVVEDIERIHVGVFHPAFPDVSENLRGTVTFLSLDGWLGEDGVERWLGHIEPLPKKPWTPTRTLDELGAAVVQLEEIATRERWAIFEGDDKGKPMVGAVNRALKAIDHPLKTMRCELTLRVLDPTPQGLTKQHDAEVLNAIEDEIVTALGERIAHLGRTTSDSVRTVIFFAAESSGVPSELEQLCLKWKDREPEAEWSQDARWEYARRFQ